MKTIVIFRKWKQATGGDGILALFPEEPSDNTGRWCMSYEHVGQHGGADYVGCIAATTPARRCDAVALYNELKSRGYDLDIRQRATPNMHAKRIAEARR